MVILFSKFCVNISNAVVYVYLHKQGDWVLNLSNVLLIKF